MSKPSLRGVPSVGRLLESPEIRSFIGIYGPVVVTDCIRETLEQIRIELTAGQTLPDHETLTERICAALEALFDPALRRVINAAGVILHTNLGRAPLGMSVYKALEPVCAGYSNLEFDLESGDRGERNDHLRTLLRQLTGAPDALVVNNNAAAVLLALHALADEKEVVVSRGELVEIGGSFRIPDVMASSGAWMVEVGTTNRTRIADYRKALSSETTVLFKAHRSNFHLQGFTEEASVAELSKLARENGVVSVYDLGSGLLRPDPALPGEPDVATALADGVDLVMFSGDKLLGGPQAGIILGRADLIERLHRNPLYRALRVDKLTIAALNAVLSAHLSDRTDELPSHRFLHREFVQLENLARILALRLAESSLACEMIETEGRCGGGSLPHVVFPSRALRIASPDAPAWRDRLRAEAIPVIAILREGDLLIDLFAVDESELESLAQSLIRTR
jgi:L-seryl-tRNA(Ser) seleniumtransferase